MKYIIILIIQLHTLTMNDVYVVPNYRFIYNNMLMEE